MTKSTSVMVPPYPYKTLDSHTKAVLLHGITKNGLYVFPPPASSPPAAFIGERASLSDWHHRLGHPSFCLVQAVLRTFQVPTLSSEASVCTSCHSIKSHALPFSCSATRSTSLLQLVHTNLWGPSPVLSISGFRYYVSFVDNYSRYTWLYPLKYKSDLFGVFLIFKSWLRIYSPLSLNLFSPIGVESFSLSINISLRLAFSTVFLILMSHNKTAPPNANTAILSRLALPSSLIPLFLTNSGLKPLAQLYT